VCSTLLFEHACSKGVSVYLSRMSAIMQEYIKSPSGNWIATRLALACFSLHTVLCTLQRHDSKTTQSCDCINHLRQQNGMFACKQVPGVREPWRLVPQSCSWQAIPLLHYLNLRSITRRPESAAPLFSGRLTGAVIRRENSSAHLLSHKPLRLQLATD